MEKANGGWMIRITKVSESYIKIDAEPGVIREMSEIFTFEVPNAKFSPAYKARKWDGKIRLLDSRSGKLYAGLVKKVHEFASERGYEIDDQTDFNTQEPFSIEEAQEFIESLSLPFQPRDYQTKSFILAIRKKRMTLVSPTGSGKSLIAYLIARYHNAFERKVLVIVPNISLVIQLQKDFEDYGYDGEVQKIYGGKSKQVNQPIVVSTWQSIYEESDEFLDQFDVIIGDEAHNFKAKSLSSLMVRLVNAKYRIGMTGTLDGSEVHELVLNGLFGPTKQIVQTKELIDNKSLADVKIRVLVLKHKKKKFESYQDEMEAIVSSSARNRFIRNLAVSLKGNTLILFAYVDKHGKILYEDISKKKEDVFFVSGEVEGEVRDEIRTIVESSTNATIVASYGVFSTGVNIKNLHNIIFASPTKSRTRTLQSIGRGLRLAEDKIQCNVFDIGDDFEKNYTYRHMFERISMYASEGFTYDITSIDLQEKENGSSVL